MNAILAGLVALVVAIAATPVAIAAARRFDILDHPGPAKPQTRPIPYLGGVAVAVGVAVPVALSRPAVLLPAFLALALGLLDDLHDVAPVPRLLAEVGIGAVTAALFPTMLPEPLGFVAVAAAVVVLINAVNVLDGLDGLVGSVCAMAAIGFAIVLDGPERTVACAAAGALAGFLLYNRPPARIYLGDAGSYMIGTVLAVLLAMAWGAGRSVGTAIGALLLVAIPVAELSFSVVRRLRARQPLFSGDRGHMYDRLVARDWSPARTTLTFAVAQMLLVVVAVVASLLDPIPAVVLVGVILAAGIATILSSGFATPHPPERPA